MLVPSDPAADPKEYICKAVDRSNTIFDQLSNEIDPYDWTSAYYRFKKRQIPSKKHNLGNIKKFIQDRKIAIVVYYRALSRYPGGNADEKVVKYTLFVDNGEFKIIGLDHNNWDASHYYSEKEVEYQIPEDFESKIDALLEKVIASINDSKKKDVYVTVVDDSTDSGSYDTEWSSIELLLYGFPDPNGSRPSSDPDDLKDPWPLLFRFHQKANVIYKGHYNNHPHSTITQEVVDAVESIFSHGRVEQFSDGKGIQLTPVEGTAVDYKSDIGGYVMPFYLFRHKDNS
eukprot:TRINITY_DN640_c0_g1_i6.p1 TRINITY_DN640_c0_g1~~TRINITY_DN640_c0_g1_i6.p1  ORF type:complete len:286 (+),score=58.97 TRINITY_DN640_c0_g1_i6:966-1823(+)